MISILKKIKRLYSLKIDKRKYPKKRKDKYLIYQNYTPRVGISHHTTNLSSMIKEASLSDRILCVPSFHLAGFHNNDKALDSHLNEYIDFSKITFGGKEVRTTLVTFPETLTVQHKTIPHTESLLDYDEDYIIKDLTPISFLHTEYDSLYGDSLSQQYCDTPTHPEILRQSKEVADVIPFNNSAWIHIRKGDMSHLTKQYTSHQCIHKEIQRIAPQTQTIYIATNETNLDLYTPLQERYRVFFYTDFPIFKKLRNKDNYKLFLAERDLREHFTVCISTFKTNNPLYSGFLSPRIGYQ